MTSSSITITNKYFIQRQPVGHGGVVLTRGKILGQLSDIYPLYLAQIVPFDDGQLSVPCETILDVTDLKGAYFYTDEAIWQEEWRGVMTQMDQAAKEAKAAAERKKALLAEVVKVAGSATAAGQAVRVKDGVPIVMATDAMEALLARLRAQGAGSATDQAADVEYFDDDEDEPA
jgi:hypothetical protein